MVTVLSIAPSLSTRGQKLPNSSKTSLSLLNSKIKIKKIAVKYHHSSIACCLNYAYAGMQSSFPIFAQISNLWQSIDVAKMGQHQTFFLSFLKLNSDSCLIHRLIHREGASQPEPSTVTKTAYLEVNGLGRPLSRIQSLHSSS